MTKPIRIIPIAAPVEPRFNIVGSFEPDGPTGEAVDHAWNRLRQESPRLYDGPVLLADLGAADANRLECRRGRYRYLATAVEVFPDLRALGVQGVVIARDAEGDECVLLGRRGSETRIYQGLWENAPSGTVEPAPGSGASIGSSDFTRALLNEGLEETGVDLGDADVRWIALLDDGEARSLDVVLRLWLRGPIDPRRTVCRASDAYAWEYADTAWAQIARLKDWVGRSGHAISPPTRALFAYLGWT
jgi:hypothetical protein